VADRRDQATRVLRIYHAGRHRSHRARERALVAAGLDVVLVVPTQWPEAGSEPALTDEPFEIVELPVVRAGDVNRHRYADPAAIAAVVRRVQPDLVDLHEEPFSALTHQVLGALPAGLPTVGYTAQNLDKRYPPPFTSWERDAFGRLTALLPCSRQAASVARGRGFSGRIEVLPLGHDPAVFGPGEQQHSDDVFRLALAGRLVPEKGVADAVQVLAEVRRHRDARLVVVGTGPESARIPELASQWGVTGQVDLLPWVDEAALAEVYRDSHVVLIPSRATSRWVEQFGRGVVEAQACGAVVAGYASGTIPEVAAGGAWLAAEADSVGLARAVARLADDPVEWDGLRSRGLAAARGKQWDAVAGLQSAVYVDAIRERPVAPRRASAAARADARAEFGAPAVTGDGQQRPFAVPGLRDQPRVGRVLGAVADLTRRR
jgi:glycosyltransferase involved in cell wall biosynthesis